MLNILLTQLPDGATVLQLLIVILVTAVPLVVIVKTFRDMLREYRRRSREDNSDPYPDIVQAVARRTN